MKKIKVILLVLFIFMLTGCGWDDVVDKYGDVIGDNGITCTYVNPSESAINKNHKLSSITVNISKQDGVKVSYNSGNYTNIYSSKDDKNYEHEFFFDKSSAPLGINYDNYDIETFLSTYGENGCPDYLYFVYEPTKDGSGKIVRGESSVRNNKDDYTEMWKNINVSSKACHGTDSIECQTYKVYYKDKVFDGIKDNDIDRELYVEIGCLNDGGSVEPYFALSNKKNFDEFSIEKGNLRMAFNNNIFSVWKVDDLITIDNSSRTCSFVNSNNFKVGIDKDGREYYFYNKQLEAPSYSIEDSESSSNRYDPLTGEEWSDPDVPSGKNGYSHVIIPFQFCDATINDPNNTNISSPNGTLKALKIVGILLFIAKILVPLIIIVLGSLDLAKGVIANDEKASSETLKSLVKRIIIGIVIFLLPTLLDLLIGLVDEMSIAINDGNFVNCTDCVLDPFGGCKAK